MSKDIYELDTLSKLAKQDESVLLNQYAYILNKAYKVYNKNGNSATLPICLIDASRRGIDISYKNNMTHVVTSITQDDFDYVNKESKENDIEVIENIDKQEIFQCFLDITIEVMLCLLYLRDQYRHTQSWYEQPIADVIRTALLSRINLSTKMINIIDDFFKNHEILDFNGVNNSHNILNDIFCNFYKINYKIVNKEDNWYYVISAHLHKLREEEWDKVKPKDYCCSNYHKNDLIAYMSSLFKYFFSAFVVYNKLWEHRDNYAEIFEGSLKERLRNKR